MKKITVLLADDERMALEHIQHVFDWEENGFEIVATAFNGRQALQKYRELSPQIVITDIKMPFMDGIELIKQIRKLSRTTEIILLTAYGEFEYAKLAIGQGVSDYLLKNELTGEVLCQKLSELKAKIESEGKAESAAICQTFTDFLNSPEDDPEKYSSNHYVKTLFETNHFYLILKEDLPLSFSINPKRRFTPRYENEILSLCMMSSQPGTSVVCAGILPGNEIAIMVDSDQSSFAAGRSALRSLAVLLRERLLEQLGSGFSVFVQYSPATGLQFRSRLNRCQAIMDLKFFFGTGKIYDLDDPKMEPQHSGAAVDTAGLDQMLAAKEDSSVCDYVDALFEQLAMDYDALVSVFQTFYFYLKKQYDALSVATETAEEELIHGESLLLDTSGIKSWIKNCLKRYLQLKEKQLELSHSRETLRTIQYIQEQYQNPELKISMIAESIGLSPARLSVIFKKETGQTINEYLTNLRVERAKELLNSGQYKIYEVAGMVGYSSSQYFSHLFYSVAGVSPIDYKRGGTG
ncbi:MAG TPA: response regulator [Caproiciproducens sp.]|nr:response regulator [Caproiciproducens sp.]